jgi:hypothetical protein
MSDRACPNCKRRPETDSDACYYCGSSLDPNNLEGPPPTVEERAAMARELDQVAPTPGDKLRLMLGQRPTPRTDAYKYHAEDGGWIAAPNNGGDIGRLPEIAEELTRLARELADALRERDNAESDRKQAEADTIRALHERNEAREQRDRLAEALEDAKAALAALKGGAR